MAKKSADLDYAKYESILRKRLAYLENRLENIEDQLDDLKSADWAEHASEAAGDEVMEGLGLSGASEIRAINAALARIAKGTYGRCVTCDEPISEPRLATLPHTPFCKNHA